MRELWRPIHGFESYEVSTYGNVRSEYRAGFLTQQVNNRGVYVVALTRDGIQHQRSVPLLVANHWIPRPERSDFITPIHLDGSRKNCCAYNLAWRPRWFAIKYHQERNANLYPDWRRPIELLETAELFPRPRECAIKYGLLETDIHRSIMERSFVFPHWFHFRWAR